MSRSYIMLYDNNKPCRLIIVVVCTTSSHAALHFTRSPDTRKHFGKFFFPFNSFSTPLHQCKGFATFFLITIEKPYRTFKFQNERTPGLVVPTPILSYFIRMNITKCPTVTTIFVPIHNIYYYHCTCLFGSVSMYL